jgi:predicted DNA-binding transcriptional regulator AlpA
MANKPKPNPDDIELLRLERVCQALGYSPHTVKRLIREGRFLRGFRLTDRGPLVWLAKDLAAWIDKRKRSRSAPIEHRGIVKRQMASRRD